MKLKMSADPEDILIFVLFCLLLLYIVCLAELNFVSFVGEQTLTGVNPLPAFAPDMFAQTMVLYLLALIAVIIGAGDHFWSFESGFGLKVGKKEKKGYARWASNKEIKKTLAKIDPASNELEAAGVPLLNDGKNIWVDDSEYHSLIVGSTGSGKTQLIVQPLVSVLAKKGESMIITDPKGEIYRDNAKLLKERGYNIVTLNFRNPQDGNAWNPLTLPHKFYKEGKKDKAIELLEDLGVNIVHEKKSDDPFWQNSGGDFFTGLALGLFEDAKGEAETIAGFLLEISKGFPKKDEVLTFHNYAFTIEAFDNKRIKQIKLSIEP
jgi:type IV secretory pathway TraG/TraD family ATPase VirD4